MRPKIAAWNNKDYNAILYFLAEREKEIAQGKEKKRYYSKELAKRCHNKPSKQNMYKKLNFLEKKGLILKKVDSVRDIKGGYVKRICFSDPEMASYFMSLSEDEYREYSLEQLGIAYIMARSIVRKYFSPINYAEIEAQLRELQKTDMEQTKKEQLIQDIKNVLAVAEEEQDLQTTLGKYPLSVVPLLVDMAIGSILKFRSVLREVITEIKF